MIGKLISLNGLMKNKYFIGQKEWIEKVKEKYIIKDEIGESVIEKNLFNKDEIKFDKLINVTNIILSDKQIKVKDKDIIIYVMSQYSSYTQNEIGQNIGINKSNTVGQRLKRFKNKLREQPELEQIISKIIEKL
jgi:hypothetical protein